MHIVSTVIINPTKIAERFMCGSQLHNGSMKYPFMTELHQFVKMFLKKSIQLQETHNICVCVTRIFMSIFFFGFVVMQTLRVYNGRSGVKQ